jgi:hypothetical protein
MHPRERVLEEARLCRMQGLPLPVDLIARAESLGILLSYLDHEDEDESTNDKLSLKERLRWLK